MKKFSWLIFLLAGVAAAQNGFYYDRAMGVNPLNGDLIPLSRAQVRVCSIPASGSPCNPLGSIFDLNGAPLIVSGGNFGQITTDNIGNFNFQCTPGNFLIQIAPTGSNTPQLNYQITCGNSSGSLGASFSTITSGTNTIPAAMVEGNGSSLTTVGTGFIGGTGQFQSITSTSGFQAISPSVPSLITSIDPSGTCSFPPYLTLGQNMICEPSQGLLWLNSGSGNSQLFATKLPDSNAFINGAVPQWVAANNDYEIKPLSGGGGGAFNAITSGTNTTATMTCGTGCTINSSGSGTITATSIPFSGNTASTNTNALVEGTAGSISTSGIGQISATQNWWTVGALAPTQNTAANTGGSLFSGHGYSFEVVYNTLAGGHTQNGGELQLNAPGFACVSGAACTITLNAITLPPGYTSYTVGMTDCGSGTCSGGELILAGCTNLASGTPCTATTAGSGALPNTNTAYPVPSPLGTNTCSPGTNPMVYVSDGTNFYPYMGVDGANTGTNPPAPYNKISICRPFWVNDSGTDPPLGRNALSLFFHLQNGTIVNAANQDRGIQVFTTNCLPITTCTDSSSHYGLEGIQVQQYIQGTPTITGSPDGEVTAGSFQMTTYNTSSYSSNGFGTNAIRATLFRQTGAAVDNQGLNGINVGFSNASTVSGGNFFAAAIKAGCSSGTAVTALFCSALHINMQNTATQFTGENAVYIPFVAAWTPRVGFTATGVDYLVRNDNYNFQTMLGGPTYVTSINTSDVSPLATTGSYNLTGSLTAIQQSAGPAISSATCSGGASQYTYRLVGIDTNGGAIAGATQNTSGGSVCTNPLTPGNPVTINTALQNSLTLGLYSRIDVYRTAGPMATGKIGFITVAGGGGTWTCTHSTISNNFSCSAILDTGLAADGGTAPTVNTTSGIATPANAVSHLVGNLFQVASPGFTTANNTSLQTITGLVFNLSGVAQNYSFHCSLAYSQATATAAVAFGIQSATVAPTNIFATGKQQVAAAAGEIASTLATLNTTTATNITSGTPGATATNYAAELDGTIEEPANDAGNVINIMVSTATGADAVTVLRGSYCDLF